MQQKLGVGVRKSLGVQPGRAVVAAAMRNRRCLRGRYNGGSVVLAPYLLYERHEIPHLAALTVSRDGKVGRAEKLSVYRLPGLTDLELTGELFEPVPEMLETHQHPIDVLLGSALGAND
ncbi:hypothetical protein ACFSCW_01715 [Sphingomonas tabacisoli]|uniref:Uncharacterized protein n=1 Tax=Sphingomonas tabacisoli TaxID=2249466 RepID=A0ABW4HXZ5_9SPHN